MVVEVANSESPKRQTNGLFVAISAILALLTKRVTGKPKAATKPVKDDEWKTELKSPKPRPKKLLSNISNKALLPFGQNQKKKHDEEENMTEGWGSGGVWQKEILMGGKCEPLDFSGAIYYDSNGKQMSEVPLRSPRASPLPGYLTRRTPQRNL